MSALRAATLSPIGAWWCARVELPTTVPWIVIEQTPLLAWIVMDRVFGPLEPANEETRAILVRELEAHAASMPAWVPGLLGSPAWLTDKRGEHG